MMKRPLSTRAALLGGALGVALAMAGTPASAQEENFTEQLFTNLGLVFPARELRDSEGVLPRDKKEFPMHTVSGFTTVGTLYKIDYYLTVKVCIGKR